MTGTLSVTLGPAVTPLARTTGTYTVIGNTGNCVATGNVVGDSNSLGHGITLSVSGNSMSGSVQDEAEGAAFTGTLSGGVITGTITFTHTLGNQSGSATFPVTLR